MNLGDDIDMAFGGAERFLENLDSAVVVPVGVGCMPIGKFAGLLQLSPHREGPQFPVSVIQGLQLKVTVPLQV